VLETAQQARLERLTADALRELNDAPRIVKDLHGLDAGDVAEEPAAAREHQHRVALHLHQLEDGDDIGVLVRVARQEARDGLIGAVEDHLDVVLARQPWVVQQLRSVAGEDGIGLVA
jgi:hypothetical protein